MNTAAALHRCQKLLTVLIFLFKRDFPCFKNDFCLKCVVCFLSSHLEADVLEVRVEVIQHSATIKYEGRLQHLLVNLLIVQFLWWNYSGMMTSVFYF